MAFFSKIRPSFGKSKDEKPAEAVKKDEKKLFVNTAASGAPSQQASSQRKIIDDITALPDGKFVPMSDLSLTNTADFAIIQLGIGDYLIIAAPDYSPHSHEVSGIKGRINRKFQASKCRFAHATQEVIRTLRDQNEEAKDAAEWGDSSEIESMAREIIEGAIRLGASDIHMETRKPKSQLFFRINGQRVEQPSLSYDTAIAIANVLYTFHADSSSKDVQWFPDRRMDTSIAFTSDAGLAIQLRFSSVPIFPSGNVSVVIRILKMVAPKNEHEFSFDRLGYTEDHAKMITDMLVGIQGLVLLVGPTNSGKSTSMRTFVRTVQGRTGNSNIKVLTVEDPVEYVITGASQIGVSRDREDLKEGGESVFQSFLKATLRQDPDVVIIGEIRDSETAMTVKDLVLSGRKIISTLHAFSSFAAFPRLREIGVPPSVLYMDNFISGVIYQRLVPVLCDHCKVPFLEAAQSGSVDERLFERLSRIVDLQEEPVFVKNKLGCEQCGWMGIGGRTVCAEVIVPDKRLLALLKEDKFADAEKYWRMSTMGGNEFGSTALAHAISKMRIGMLDPHHVESQVGILKVIREADEIQPEVILPPSSMGAASPMEDFGALSNASLYA
jgi:type II secretory ATPase GspE/PulE/Tfp pilus assembly ATPase PilB-like protein